MRGGHEAFWRVAQGGDDGGHAGVRLLGVEGDAVEGLAVAEAHGGRDARVPADGAGNVGMVAQEDALADEAGLVLVVAGHGGVAEMSLKRGATWR